MSDENPLLLNDENNPLVRLHGVGAVAATVACLSIAVDTKGLNVGGGLAAALFAELERTENDPPEYRNAVLAGFCDAIEPFIAGWVTGIKPLEKSKALISDKTRLPKGFDPSK